MTSVESRPPPTLERRNALAWAAHRLFPNIRSGILTVILIPLLGYMAYRAFLFVAVNGQWEVVERNLTLFMQGTFPRDEQWRIVAQIVLLALAAGIGAGTASASAHDRAVEAGLPFIRSGPLDLIRRFWSVITFVLILLYFASTATPWLVVVGTIVSFVIGLGARFLPSRWRNVGWALMGLALVAGFQVVSGTAGRAWIISAVLLALGSLSVVSFEGLPKGWARLGGRTAVVLGASAVVFLFYSNVVDPGVGWDHWSGLHLTLWVSALAIVLSFPLGLMLALARRSSLPALSALATGYIELIRGVPLITLLFMGQFILGFMLPTGSNLSDISRAIAAMTLFTAAYVAEIVRGGLQSLPRGQTEAGQALGLAPPTTMRKIILPQALRAVIPAMVGQFISLFKDSTLLLIIAIHEFLGVRSLVHAQADFRAVAHAETLVFAAIGYWAFSYAMSKESQRLEHRLRVGER